MKKKEPTLSPDQLRYLSHAKKAVAEIQRFLAIESREFPMLCADLTVMVGGVERALNALSVAAE